MNSFPDLSPSLSIIYEREQAIEFQSVRETLILVVGWCNCSPRGTMSACNGVMTGKMWHHDIDHGSHGGGVLHLIVVDMSPWSSGQPGGGLV